VKGRIYYNKLFFLKKKPPPTRNHFLGKEGSKILSSLLGREKNSETKISGKGVGDKSLVTHRVGKKKEGWLGLKKKRTLRRKKANNGGPITGKGGEKLNGFHKKNPGKGSRRGKWDSCGVEGK